MEFQSTNIKRTNLYEMIADQIEEKLMDDTSLIGERLPSEQSVADSFHVSRNIVREAFKILRERGLIDVRNGEGVFIAKPEPQMLSKIIKRIVLMDGADFKDLYELRYALETTACKLAIRRISQEQIQTLQKILNEMEQNIENQEAWAKYDLDFHKLIVKASNNELLYSFYKPILSSLREIFSTAWEFPGAKEKGRESHKRIMEAFLSRDESQAIKYLEEHLMISQENILASTHSKKSEQKT